MCYSGTMRINVTSQRHDVLHGIFLWSWLDSPLTLSNRYPFHSNTDSITHMSLSGLFLAFLMLHTHTSHTVSLCHLLSQPFLIVFVGDFKGETFLRFSSSMEPCRLGMLQSVPALPVP